MDSQAQILDLRRDYDRLLLSFKQSEDQFHARQHALTKQLVQLRHQNAALKHQIQTILEKSDQLRQLVSLLEQRLDQKKDALTYAEERCISAEENLYRLQIEVQKILQQNPRDLSQKIQQLQIALNESYKETEEVSEIAARWKQKYEQLQHDALCSGRKRTKSNQVHPLVTRIQQMVRDCTGIQELSSAKQSWHWVKMVVQQHMKRKKGVF